MPRAARSPTPVVWTSVRSRGSPVVSKRRSSAARTASATPKPELPSTITVWPLAMSAAAASALRIRGRIGSALPGGRDLAGDDQPLDLVGALVDLRELGVAIHPLDRIVLGVAGAAVDLDGVA